MTDIWRAFAEMFAWQGIAAGLFAWLLWIAYVLWLRSRSTEATNDCEKESNGHYGMRM